MDFSHNRIKSLLNASNNDFLVIKIYFQFNRLKKNDFLSKNFKFLDLLDLCGNQIEELKIDNFYHLSRLKFLNLSFNPIKNIEPSFF